jgi:plasmid stabilization system protein ParE
MAKVKWSEGSIKDLKEICKFIASDSPYYAKIFNDRVLK